MLTTLDCVTLVMRAIFVVFVLALVTIAFGIYSEAVLMSGGALMPTLILRP